MKILIIEDDKMTQLLYKNILKDHDLDFAGDGKQAVKFLANNIYNLLLVDLNLPEVKGYPLSGLDILKWFRDSEHNYGVPAIVVSAYLDLLGVGTKETTEFNKFLGCDEIIKKPFDREILLAVVKKYE